MSMLQTGSPTRNLPMEAKLAREHVHCFCREAPSDIAFSRTGRRFLRLRRCCDEACRMEWRSYEPVAV